jgi:cystathionine beta-lyase/cystathionine gamma-synthase
MIMRFGTLAIHAGQEPDPSTGAIMTPIYQTSTYVQAAPGQHKGYEYSRTHNPTRRALEQNLAALERAQHGLCFASGLAATDAVLRLLKSGDHVVAGNDLYGGTYRLFERVYRPFGLDFSFVDAAEAKNVAAALRPNTRLVWIETPTNPLLKVTDIEQVAEVCRGARALLAVDNTFATPYLQQPLELGADLVVHSVTKYLGGHSDLVGGAILTSSGELRERLAFVQNAVGAVPGPMDCFLVLRGTKTLAVRMDRHLSNARRIAEHLCGHAAVARVYYPGFEDHPGHAVARRQMRGFGGMISFVLKDESEATARALVSRTRVFSLAESLGGVESLVCHPATMTHASIPAEMRLARGVDDGLVRLSVGIEEVEDLQEDLRQALA